MQVSRGMRLLILQIIAGTLVPIDCFTVITRCKNCRQMMRSQFLAHDRDQEQSLFREIQREGLSEGVSEELLNEVEQGQPSEWQIMKEVREPFETPKLDE